MRGGVKPRALRASMVAAMAWLTLIAPAVASDVDYLYDTLGRIIAVTSSDGSQSSYKYDKAGNRVAQQAQIWSLASATDKLYPGQAILRGQILTSPSGRYKLYLQKDGNVVLYGQNGPLWSSGTYGKPAVAFIMQGDGNLVIYGPVFEPLWSSATASPSAQLHLQNDGNLVVYGASGPVWNSGTACGLC